jgi:hypothetical protein
MVTKLVSISISLNEKIKKKQEEQQELNEILL